MTKAVVLIPVKSLSHAKSRMSPQLGLQQRKELVLLMLQGVLDALARSTSVERVFVVTPDEEVTDHVQRRGVTVIQDSPGGGLNAALEKATSLIAQTEPDSPLLILPADLPLITPHSVDSIVKTGELLPMPVVVASPSRDGGTNALLVRPPGVVRYSFGPGSFELHRRAALSSGVRFEQYDSLELLHDTDTIQDIIDVLDHEPSPVFKSFVAGIANIPGSRAHV
ncbi:MAG: 2-phospho-L-lactate guanylyltransferase [Candidatus Thorarchaeota archaeon]|nr:2-phospho-L-lactate guanylyltransferase [Candidatus Thorarchaeota archaeon]